MQPPACTWIANFPPPARRVEGLDGIDRVIDIDQSPIGRTPRSNPATYTGLFAPLRELFAAVPEARARGYGRRPVQLQRQRRNAARPARRRGAESRNAFFWQMSRTCDVFRGQRYNAKLSRSHSAAEHPRGSADDRGRCAALFQAIPAVAGKLADARRRGSVLLHLGQNAPPCRAAKSAAREARRELAKRARGALVILVKPTRVCTSTNVAQLLEVLLRRATPAHLLVIEHNLDVIKCADWCHRPRPGSGADGGQVVALRNAREHCGAGNPIPEQYLRHLLGLPSSRRLSMRYWTNPDIFPAPPCALQMRTVFSIILSHGAFGRPRGMTLRPRILQPERAAARAAGYRDTAWARVRTRALTAADGALALSPGAHRDP